MPDEYLFLTTIKCGRPFLRAKALVAGGAQTCETYVTKIKKICILF